MSTKNQVEREPIAVTPNANHGGFLGRLSSFGGRILIATGLTILAPVVTETILDHPASTEAHASGLTPCDPLTEERYDYDDINGDGVYTPYIDWAYCRPLPTTTTSTIYIPPPTTHKVTTTTIVPATTTVKPSTTTTTIELSTTPPTSSTEVSTTTTTEAPTDSTNNKCCDVSTSSVKETVIPTSTNTKECPPNTDQNGSTVTDNGACGTPTTIEFGGGTGNDGNEGSGFPLWIIPAVIAAGATAEQTFRKRSTLHGIIAAAKRRKNTKKTKIGGIHPAG